MNYALFLIPAILLGATVFYAVRAMKRGGNAKRAFMRQLAAFAVVCVICLAGSATVLADEPEAMGDAAAAVADGAKGMGLLAAALVTGLSGIGGGIAVAAAAPAAIGATSEDPKAFGKALIFVALGEGIALYGLLISILILAKV